MKKIINNISIILSILFNKVILRKPDFSEKRVFLQTKIIEENNLKKKTINNLKDVEFSAFSQFGEDGIISWLTNQIPDIKKIFIEIGTQDYWESNTRYLLKSQQWKGYILEASDKNVRKIKSQSIYWQNNLSAINVFVDQSNIEKIINTKVKEKQIGLLSVDIDGNDYWILDKINIVSDIIVCEYNPIFGDIYKITVPYDKNFERSKKHYSNLFFGCSIKALIHLMEKKNYIFLGSNSQGMNAFFVNKKKIGYFENKIKDKIIFPPFLREGRNDDGKLNFKNLNENINLIKELEVFDIDQNIYKKLSTYDNLYSDL